MAREPRISAEAISALFMTFSSACYPHPAMGPATYHVRAEWDPEASVWVATSDDVPGLATEAETIEVLTDRLRIMIPELLEANR